MLKLPRLALIACILAASLGAATLRGAPAAEDGLPANLGHDLHALAAWQRAQSGAQPEIERKRALTEHVRASASRLQVDAAGRVTVNLLLDGTVPAATVKAHIESLGATVIGEHAARRTDRRDGVLSVRLPIERAVEAAQTPGVHSVMSAHRPWRRTYPQLPAQGVPVLHVDQVLAAGTTGAGITVGVISDSYDLTSPHAFLDVQAGALPNNVIVLQDGNPGDGDTDEGRAMLEIVHEVAPGATVAFNTSGDTQTTFADAIHALRTNSAAQCDVIVDDIAFPDEPFFSDGIVSQAVDDVVTSKTLAGRPVIFYSASGNDGSNGYHADFNFISDQDVRSGNAGSNNLIFNNTADPSKSVPASLTAGGFHNFKAADTGKGKQIVQRVTVSGSTVEIDLQWDDPFLPNGITTDYNLLVFDEKGVFHPDLSGTDDNFSTGEPLELVDLDPNPDGSARTYQLVIARASGGGANRLFYVPDGGALAGKFLHTGQSTLYGHPAAANADGVAAFDVHSPTVPEDFDSFGPVEILFDSMGNRLATPEVRMQPDISGPDGVDTTFFPQPANQNDSDGDGFPNFYGTSAAAPHAAAVAALMLEAAGGHGSLTAVQMRTLLESTAVNHDLDPAMCTATLTSADGQEQVTVTATGDDTALSDSDPEFFKVTFAGPAGSSLRKLVLNLGPVGETFDTSVSNGQPLTLGLAQGGLAKGDIAGGTAAANSAILRLRATAGRFVPGATLAFGIGRDDSSGNPSPSADGLAGATVTARCILADGTVVALSGAFANKTGHGYSPDVGYGLINAEAAFQSLKGN